MDGIMGGVAASAVPEECIVCLHPVTTIQRAMMLQTTSGTGLYVTQGSLLLQGNLDLAAMGSAWQAVVFQAAWACVLSTITGADDVAFRQGPVGSWHRRNGRGLSKYGAAVNLGGLKDRYPISYCGMGELYETVFVFENHANGLVDSAFGSLQIQSTGGHKCSEVPLSLVLEFVNDVLVLTFKLDQYRIPLWRIKAMMQSYGAVVSDMMAGAAVARLGRRGIYAESSLLYNSLNTLREGLLPNKAEHTIVSLLKEQC
ncbi:linear gramicidin synthase subunit B [Colletotrichum tofieldiae]|nr:linear gramicidin synthase subunit B [Colletotrichum tofieldiae]